MKKSKKIILRLIPVLLLVVVVLNSSVFGFNSFTNENLQDLGEEGDAGVVGTAANNAWAAVRLILQILAVAAIVFAGVRYMFASADQKADIKKSMVILVIGAVFVFGASIIIDFIVQATGSITGIQEQ